MAYNHLYSVPKIKSAESEKERRERVFREYVAKHHFNGKQGEVLHLLLDGCSNCEIAEKLFLAESTVKYHVKNILKTTGHKNRTDLIADYMKAEKSEND